ncbi:hypothetical protein [Streptomyces sp. NPDC001480]
MTVAVLGATGGQGGAVVSGLLDLRRRAGDDMVAMWALWLATVAPSL